MDQFSQPVLSKKLLTIIANSTTSTNQIIFKRAIASSDKYKLDDLSGFDDTSISTIKKASETVFSNVTIDGNGIQLTAIFSSNGNDSNYDINTILFTAEYGGQEFLAFSQIANYSLTVPAGSSKEVFNLTLKPKIIIDSVKNISTTVNPSGVATNEYVDSHDSELKKMIDEGTSDRKNIWTKFSDYILKSGNPQTIDTKLTFTEKINGTATKSDALATARTINGTNFDGTANISIKASNDSDLVHKSSAETISGDKNFTGKLQKGGIDVATASDVASAQNSAINTAKSYTDSSINSIDVGGRNLLLGTSVAHTCVGNNSINGNFDNQGALFNLASGKKVSDLYNQYGSSGYLILSFDWVASGSTISGSFSPVWSNTPWGVISPNVTIQPSITNKSGHYEVTVPLSNSGYSTSVATVLRFRHDNLQGNITIINLKLEAGNKATDWTPAPEDKLDANANAASATKLATPRKIGGVAFDGTADITLPGVNSTGNQNTTGLANAVQSLEITSGTDLSTIKGYGGSAVYHIAGGITLYSTPSDYSGKGAILKVTESGTTVYQELIDVMTDNGSWIRIIDGSTVNDWQTKGGGGWSKNLANGQYYDSISQYFTGINKGSVANARHNEGKFYYLDNKVTFTNAFDFKTYKYAFILTTPETYNGSTQAFSFNFDGKVVSTNWQTDSYNYVFLVNDKKELLTANPLNCTITPSIQQMIIKGVFRIPTNENFYNISDKEHPFIPA